MRLVVRSLCIRPWSPWVRVITGFVTAAVRFWPWMARGLMAAFRAWRVTLGLVIGLPVAVGWPLLFWLIQDQPGYRKWLQGIAIPWWIILGATGLVLLLAARACAAELPTKE